MTENKKTYHEFREDGFTHERATIFATTYEYEARFYQSFFSDKFNGNLTGRFIYMHQTYLDNYRLINRHVRCGGTEFTYCSTVGGGNLGLNSDR